MKKQYLKLEKYLFHKNDDSSGAGSGSGANTGSGGGSADIDVSGLGGDAGSAGAGSGEGAGSNGDQGAQTKDWRESIPKELLDSPRLKDVESVEDLAKALVNIKTPEIPETMNLPQGVPEEIGKWGIEKGMTQDQFDAVLQKHGELEQARLGHIVAVNKTGEEALYKSWGENKDENLALANRVVEFADPTGDLKFIEFLRSPESNFAAGNPMIMQLFYNIGKSMKEGGALKSGNPPKNPSKRKVPVEHELYPEQAPKN